MTGFVYFLKPADSDGPIKIGFSADPERRIRSLMNWSPVKLDILCIIPGNKAAEYKIQRRFADLHSHMEWFHFSPAFGDFIDRIKAGVDWREATDFSDLKPLRTGRSGLAKSSKARRVAFGLDSRVNRYFRKHGTCPVEIEREVASLVWLSHEVDELPIGRVQAVLAFFEAQRAA